ncbi:hypothetical protein [Luteimicrobium album]|uniref:hypothetical protein n=1 Tax=Luteimicrobium album TaxID=1054550 RepID=UPI0024E0DE32|nr:hypothetical protein [Luteimicrobium album]
MGVIACCAATAVAVFVKAGLAPTRLWNSLAVGLGAYVLLLVVLIVNTVFEGYEANVDPAVREADDELQRREPPELTVRHTA